MSNSTSNVEYYEGSPEPETKWYYPGTELCNKRPAGFYYKDYLGWLLGPFASPSAAISGYEEFQRNSAAIIKLITENL